MIDRQKVRELCALDPRARRGPARAVSSYSPYAPDHQCSHTRAIDVTPPLTDQELAMPYDHPQFWDARIRIREWICADCYCAVDPHAYQWPT